MIRPSNGMSEYLKDLSEQQRPCKRQILHVSKRAHSFPNPCKTRQTACDLKPDMTIHFTPSTMLVMGDNKFSGA